MFYRSKEVIQEKQYLFYQELNEFLLYYAFFFPNNEMDTPFQHEVRPLSKYELSKRTVYCQLQIDDINISLPPIIEDFTNYTGIPEITYINYQKIQEFEKFLQNRHNNPILPYHQFFILARSFYRISKAQLGPTIITTIMTAFESLFELLEQKEIEFSLISKLQKRKKFHTLNFYFNFMYIKLAKILKKNYQNKFNKLIELIKLIKILNLGRMIRNEIIHEAKFNYNPENDIINFLNTNTKRKENIKFQDLWASILKIFDSLNILLLEITSSSINWRIKSDFIRENMGISLETSKENIFLMRPNYDWREIHYYNIEYQPIGVPPDKIPKFLRSRDGVDLNLNLDMTLKYETIGELYRENGSKIYKILTFPSELTSDEINELIENKTFNIKIPYAHQILQYRSCENCNYLIPIHRYKQYKNNKCTECGQEFLFD